MFQLPDTVLTWLWRVVASAGGFLLIVAGHYTLRDELFVAWVAGLLVGAHAMNALLRRYADEPVARLPAHQQHRKALGDARSSSAAPGSAMKGLVTDQSAGVLSERALDAIQAELMALDLQLAADRRRRRRR